MVTLPVDESILQIVVESLLWALALVGPLTVFVVVAWRHCLAGEAWEFMDEAELSEEVGSLRKKRWYPLWLEVARKESGLPSGLARHKGSVQTMGEKARADEGRFSDRHGQYQALAARAEAVAEKVGAVRALTQGLQDLWGEAGDKLSAQLIQAAFDAHEGRLREESHQTACHLRDLHGDVSRMVGELGLAGLQIPNEVGVPVAAALKEGRAAVGRAPARASDFSNALEQRRDSSQRARRELQRGQEAAAELIDWTAQTVMPLVDERLERAESKAQVSSALQRAHIEVVGPGAGEPSDGRYHEEIAQGAATEECAAGQVIRTVEHGYVWRGTVLRKAKVVVASDNAEPEQQVGRWR